MKEQLIYFLQVLTMGVCTGVSYGLVGLSFTAIFNVSGIINFAQGDLLMAGAFLAFIFVTTLRLPFVADVFIIAIISALLGISIYWFTIKRMMKQNYQLITMIIATIGCSLVISGIVGIVTEFAWFNVPPLFGHKSWRLWGVSFVPQNVVIIIGTSVLLVAYWFLLKKTFIGIALRAIGCNRDMAILVGVRTSAMITFAFMISATMSGLAGLLFAPISGPNALMGFPMTIKGFIAALLVGLGNPFAAILGESS